MLQTTPQIKSPNNTTKGVKALLGMTIVGSMMAWEILCADGT
jgi:hypothetical protein